MIYIVLPLGLFFMAVLYHCWKELAALRDEATRVQWLMSAQTQLLKEKVGLDRERLRVQVSLILPPIPPIDEFQYAPKDSRVSPLSTD